MRIIGGKYKGKRLLFQKNLITRPLKDSVKENLFNILIHSNEISTPINKSSILDIYSGIGSFGLECLSRGASNVMFVEKDITALSFLKKNLLNLSLDNESVVIENNLKNIFVTTKKFNILFLDPPFKDSNFLKVLLSIKKRNILKKKHLVILHRETNSNDDFINIIKIFLTRNYGRSKLIFGTLH